MISDSFELFINFVQMFVWTWFMTSFFGFKRNNQSSKIAFVIMWVVAFFEISYINHIVVYDGFLTGIVAITLVIYGRFFLNGKTGLHIFIAFYSAAIIFTISSIIIFFVSYITGLKTKSLIADLTYLRAVMMCLSKILEFLVFKFVLRINSDYTLTKKEWILFVSMPIFTWIAITLITQATIEYHNYLPHMFYIALIMVALNIIIYFFMYKIKQDEKNHLDDEVEKQAKISKEESITELNTLCKNLFSFQHDVDKHLDVLCDMTQNKKYDKIEDYIQNVMKLDLAKIPRIIQTESEVFNSIINTRLARCKELNILVNMNVSDDGVKGINDYYATIVLGNIFDNAIEAADMTEERRIMLAIQPDGEYTSVFMANSFNEEYSNTNLETSKEDNLRHGIGTGKVINLVKKNGGMIDYFINDMHMFCCDIMLKN